MNRPSSNDNSRLGSAGFLGDSEAARHVTKLLPRLAASDAIVLLTGETGTGKSFVAGRIHRLGPRASDVFHTVNCAAIPDPLIESQLFGHERGAFTGALDSRQGAFEAAATGTLFLDEIGELSPAAQAKLLRVLDERRFERVGSNRSILVRARVIAATNRDLPAMVEAGQFRGDLFFRISVVTLCVPPARHRGDDLVLLSRHILDELAPRAGRCIHGFSSEALDVIRRHSWPGNVRELRNAIEHAIVVGECAYIQPDDFPASVVASKAEPASARDPLLVRLPPNLVALERLAIRAALRETGGNRTRAAALLGINRQTLYNKLADGQGPD
jgi:transcriptional regulator with PAS, ATPase and Fis domain